MPYSSRLFYISLYIVRVVTTRNQTDDHNLFIRYIIPGSAICSAYSQLQISINTQGSNQEGFRNAKIFELGVTG